MKDIELPPLPDPKYIWHDADDPGEAELFEFEFSGAVDGRCDICERLYSGEQMSAYARAAIEADRAQRVPDVDSHAELMALADRIEEAGGRSICVMPDCAELLRALLASTPAPAQQEPDGIVVSAQVDHSVVQWTKQTSNKGGGDPKNSYSWPITGDAVYLQKPPQQERKPTLPPGHCASDWGGRPTGPCLYTDDEVMEILAAHGIKE